MRYNKLPNKVCDITTGDGADLTTASSSKLYQQLQLSAFGFLTPRTLVTTVPEQAATFYQSCRKRVVYKSVSGVRSIVRRLEDKDLPRLELVRNCPTQFQEVVDGVDIRVHVVGDDVFATELKSTASDYRYAAATGEGSTRLQVAEGREGPERLEKITRIRRTRKTRRTRRDDDKVVRLWRR
jgi:glutathione synthase/RimK-type ligase-like ATP-grasp enzyme